jgi:hypothetical protein
MERTVEDVEQALNIVLESGVEKSRYPTMTYEQGIEIALRWMLGEVDDAEFPFDTP